MLTWLRPHSGSGRGSAPPGELRGDATSGSSDLPEPATNQALPGSRPFRVHLFCSEYHLAKATRHCLLADRRGLAIVQPERHLWVSKQWDHSVVHQAPGAQITLQDTEKNAVHPRDILPLQKQNRKLTLKKSFLSSILGGKTGLIGWVDFLSFWCVSFPSKLYQEITGKEQAHILN